MQVRCCFCDISYFTLITEEEKIKFFQQKKICQHCINSLENDIDAEKNDNKKPEEISNIKKWFNNYIFYPFAFKFKKSRSSTSSLNRKPKKKCYKCFSQKHDTEFCDEKFATPNIFLPKIDRDLFYRFLHMLHPLEQYTFAFSSKQAFNNVQLKRLIIAPNMEILEDYRFLPFFDNSTFFITENLELIGQIGGNYVATSYLFDYLFTSITSKLLIFSLKMLSLKDIEISGAHFLQLLSTKITFLDCRRVEFTSPVKFSDTIKVLPFIERLYINKTNFKYDSLWIPKFLNNCRNCIDFEFPLTSLNLDTDCLPAFIKKNSRGKRRVYLNYDGFDQALIDKLPKAPIMFHYDHPYFILDNHGKRCKCFVCNQDGEKYSRYFY